MKKTQIVKELREKDINALSRELLELNEKITKLRLDASLRKLKNVKEIAGTRKKIARILTIINEKAFENQKVTK